MKNLVVLYLESDWYSLNSDDFDDYGEAIKFGFQNTYITFQTSDLIRELKSRKFKNLPSIIDLESFDKQMSQEGKEFRDSSNWKAISFLKYHKEIDSEFKLTRSNIKSFLEHLATLYNRLLENDSIETQRFNEVELGINKLIFERQLKGVKVDIPKIESECAELEKKVYSIKNELQLKFRIFTPDNCETQKLYLDENKLEIFDSILKTFKLNRKQDEVCNLFYELIRTQHDLNSFLFILSHWGGVTRTFPSYYGFGSITSRITLREPALQNLRKRNRTIIIPDDGKKLCYVDYSQFEAGILASLSKDVDLINLYNSDIYSDLAEKILGERGRRKEAKVLFYKYIYGSKSLSQRTKRYFSRFEKLEKFINKLTNDFVEDKKIATNFGNTRYAQDDEALWALSHLVQSTASYIYKKALLKVKEEEPLAEFLIPMHDGTVYQILEEEYDNVTAKIENIYNQEFKNICPEIDPSVSIKESFN